MSVQNMISMYSAPVKDLKGKRPAIYRRSVFLGEWYMHFVQTDIFHLLCTLKNVQVEGWLCCWDEVIVIRWGSAFGRLESLASHFHMTLGRGSEVCGGCLATSAV